jgi:predicted nucleic acid-binding Zn ribbon protein
MRPAMPTYIYETTSPGKPARRFEVEQRMSEPALTRHPETGEPVRRVITGGLGFIGASDKTAGDADGCCAAGTCPAMRGEAPHGACGLPGCSHAHH